MVIFMYFIGLLAFAVIVKVVSDAIDKIIHKEKKEKDFDFDAFNKKNFGV